MPTPRFLTLPPELGLPPDLFRRPPAVLDRDLARLAQRGRSFGRDIAARGTREQWIRACLAANELVADEAVNPALVPAKPSGGYDEWRSGAAFVANVSAPLSQLSPAHRQQTKDALRQLAAHAHEAQAQTGTTALEKVFPLPRRLLQRHSTILSSILQAFTPFGPYAHLNPARLARENPFGNLTSRTIVGFDSGQADPYVSYFAPTRLHLRTGGLICTRPSESDGDEPYVLIAAAGLDAAAIQRLAASGNVADLGASPTLYRMDPPWPTLSGGRHVDATRLVDIAVDASGTGLWAASYSLWENDSADAQKRAEAAKVAGMVAEKICSTIGTSLQNTGNPYAVAAGVAAQIIGQIVKGACEVFAVLIKLIEHDIVLGGGSFSSSVLYSYAEAVDESVRPLNFTTRADDFDYTVQFVEELVGSQELQKGQPIPAGVLIKIRPTPQTFLFPPDAPDGVWLVGAKGDFEWKVAWKGYSDQGARWKIRTLGDTRPDQASAVEVRRRVYLAGELRDAEDAGGTTTVPEVYVTLSVHWWYDAKGILGRHTTGLEWGNGRCHFEIVPV